MDTEMLQRMHWVEGKSQREIARELHVSRTAVRYYMSKFDIPIRNQKVAIGFYYRTKPRVNPKFTPETDKAYLAGFIDGEGYIGVSRRVGNLYTFQVIVANTVQEPIEWIKEKFGGHTGMRYPKGNRKPLYYWSASGHSAMELLSSTLPYLKIKRNVAKLCLDFYTSIKSRVRAHSPDNSLTPLEANRREVMYKQIKELSKRGKR